MKKYILILSSALLMVSCSDFLDREPKDALSPGTFWKTEADAKLALTGCYRDFEDSYSIMYRDCGSDNAYNFHRHEGWQAIGDGSMSPGDPGNSDFSYTTINNCNEFLENIDKVNFVTPGLKDNYIAEIKFIRAYRYFIMSQSYGGVPLVTKTFATPNEAKLPQTPRAEIEEFIISELKAAIPNLLVSAESGRITKSAGQALLMRMYLFKGMYNEALQTAKEISGHNLLPSYESVFLLENKGSEESILEYEHLENDMSMDLTPFLPNGNGGWSSVVPVQSLVDAYETIDGLTIDEAKALGKYDETNPYFNRDPRLRQTIIYPGQLWEGATYSSIISGDKNHPLKEDNSTKSGYNFKKYFNNLDQFPDRDFWNTSRSMILFRYAEVLLTIAEAKIELNLIDEEMYNALNKVRNRAGLPNVDKTKYNTQSKLRELVRRERRVEFAFEGMRRWDIIRWGIAKDVMNGPVYGAKQGTILNETYENGDKKLKLDGAHFYIETRKFENKNNLLPIPQTAIDKNNRLKQNPDY